jgi:chitodextrinase
LAVGALSAAVQAGQAPIFWEKDYIRDGGGGTVAVVKKADVTVPSMPAGLTSTGTTENSASMSWQASTDGGGSGLAGYWVFRGESVVGFAGTTQFTDLMLTPSTTYEFKVAAVDLAGNQSGLSSGLSITTSAGSSGGLDAPAMLTATAAGTSQVQVTWAAPQGSVDHYEVWRRTTGSYSKIDDAGSTSYADAGVSPNVTYLYAVRAVNGSVVSSFSTADIATTMVFADDPLIQEVSVVKAQHLVQLREGVDRVRTAAGLDPAAWTDTPLGGVAAKAIHISELRTKLQEALTALAVPPPAYTDSTLTAGIPIKKAHIAELRAIVK